MYEYQQYGRFFAQVAGNMEELGAQELREFGVKDIKPVYRGLWFQTTLEKVYRINYRARLLTRILAPLKTSAATAPNTSTKPHGICPGTRL